MNRSALKKTFSPIAYAAPLSINRNLVYAFKKKNSQVELKFTGLIKDVSISAICTHYQG